MSKLKDKQYAFARKIAVLELVAIEMGYQPRNGHAFRCQNCKTGSTNSLHKSRLAKDIILDRDGVWLQETEDYKPLGLVWESMGGTWGGRWGDGNHFSTAYGGRK